ncbi:hypothetical protein [Paenibacillus larvae]|uniref:hypothetical protein n=1 Tax=Paenibacillus larvae TaxID=1464 RepID=UPI00131A0A08|nr:hypothetical protein [Paenibacillus larvae]MDR5567452.1 hypothetical protein [Paenibacillus larvae]MDR5594542.1 hypothetical protein [Paenibacillus larvae]
MYERDNGLKRHYHPENKKETKQKKSIGFAKIHVTLLDIGGYTAHPGMDNLNLNRNVFGRR